MTYQDIVLNFSKKPRHVHTVPLTRRESKWFWVYSERNTVYVESGKTTESNSQIKGKRALNSSEFDKMLNLYHQRKQGRAVSKEAMEMTRNQVYWYGIFADLEI
jgi:hypothetical protein